MTEPSPANLELAIALPLGVVANQLTRIEADLRFLSMKASAFTLGSSFVDKTIVGISLVAGLAR